VGRGEDVLGCYKKGEKKCCWRYVCELRHGYYNIASTLCFTHQQAFLRTHPIDRHQLLWQTMDKIQ
jgi:hypothetical protein